MFIRKVSVYLHATFHTQDRWQTLKNENTIQKKTSKVEFNYGNILAHIWNSTSCF